MNEKIIAKSTELNDSLANVQKELKKIASVKCRLNKMPGRSDYQIKMDEALAEEVLLKEVRDYLQGSSKKTVNELTAEDIEAMDYDTVCRAIKSIQSKKTHTKWAEDCERDEDGTFIPGSGPSYKEACRIEDLLVSHRNTLKPSGRSTISKAKIQAIIDENLKPAEFKARILELMNPTEEEANDNE